MVDHEAVEKGRIAIVVNLARQINAYREKHNMSKARFARECGVSTGFLRHLERGEANPTLDLIEKLADFLGVSATDLLFLPPNDENGEEK